MEIVSLAERPDLAPAAFEIPYGADDGVFMQGSPVPLLVRRSRLVKRWPDYVLVLVDQTGSAVARGVMVPFCAQEPGRERFPAEGWDQVAIWAAEDTSWCPPRTTSVSTWSPTCGSCTAADDPRVGTSGIGFGVREESGTLRRVDTDDVQQVIGYELALLAPHVRRSQARVEQLLDPDFREIGASGRFWTRREMVSALAEADGDGEPIEATEVEGAVVGPGLILLTYVSDPQGRAARRSSLWRRSGGGWRLLHHQGTLLNSV